MNAPPPSPAAASAAWATAGEAVRRAEAAQRDLHIFLHLDGAGALTEARELERRAPDERGPLHGLPVAVKDNIAVRGMPSTSGSAILRGYRPPFNATVVERLRRAGAVILGTANLDEFAMGSATTTGFRGPTRNPRDPERIAGGSSGGPAAAVAAGAVAAALGTDTGGSVRQPAAHCGVFGMRPTYGRVSRFGITAYASSFDQVGCLAANPADLGRVLGAVAGPDPRDATSAEREVPDFAAAAGNPALPTRIAVCGSRDVTRLDVPSRGAFRAAVRRFRDAGCEVREVPLPDAISSVATYYVLACAEASSNLSRFDGMRYGCREEGDGTLDGAFRESRSAGFGDEVRLRILLGTAVLSEGYRDSIYRAALTARKRIRARLLAAFEQGDLLLLPITRTAPRRFDDRVAPGAEYEGDRFTVLASLAGFPAISIPAGRRSGLPFGVELMAPPWQEARLLAAAAAFQQLPDPHPTPGPELPPTGPSPAPAAAR